MSDTDMLTRDGMAALARGGFAEARDLLSRACAPGIDAPWLALAQCCNRLGDAVGEEAALDGLLNQDIRHIGALLRKGDLRGAAGDDRAATSFYRSALNMAAQSENVPAGLHPLLARAEAFITLAQERYAAFLGERLAATGTTDASARVAESVDLLLGKRQLYLQQPSVFYFPGLPQRAFYERDEFDWIGAVEAATPAIIAELAAVDAQTGTFDPYVRSAPERPRPNNELRDDPRWGAWYLWEGGAPVADHAALCPATMAALAQTPMPVIAARSPMALFSRLAPGTEIAPHHGMLNTRLICHLPLVVPDECGLRVGSETRGWEVGKALIFDDSFEHEAWNRSQQSRTILLFEIWRPEITADERVALTLLFEAIGDYDMVD